MPKLAKPLSPLSVGRLSRPGYHAVGVIPGLNLQISGLGARSWILRVRVGGKRREIGLGAFPAVTLQAAREAARAHRSSIVVGVDPVRNRRDHRSALRAATSSEVKFKVYADEHITGRESSWKNKKHAAQWRSTLEAYAYPVIGDLAIGEIDTSHVLQILKPIWTSKTETASRVQGRIKVILDASIAQELRKGPNPALWTGHLSAILPSPDKIATVEHHPALPYEHCPRFMLVLAKVGGVAARALEFLIVTVVRSETVRGTVWREFDLVNKVWVIPAVRMKAERDHRVPLTPRMLEMLAQRPRGEPDDLVFAAPRGGALSDMALSKVVRDMNRRDQCWIDPVSGRTAVPHGFRSSFRDWAAEKTDFNSKVAEAALAHVLGEETEVAYLRSDLFKKRRTLMQMWNAFLAGPAAKRSRPMRRDPQTP